MNNYYQRMADEYRKKFLDLEKDYIYLKNNNEYDSQKFQQQMDESQRRFQEKLPFELNEEKRNSREQLNEKELFISNLKQRMQDMEYKIEKDEQEFIQMQRLYTNLENDFKESIHNFEEQMHERDEQIERQKRQNELQVSKLVRSYEEQLKQQKQFYEDKFNKL